MSLKTNFALLAKEPRSAPRIKSNGVVIAFLTPTILGRLDVAGFEDERAVIVGWGIPCLKRSRKNPLLDSASTAPEGGATDNRLIKAHVLLKPLRWLSLEPRLSQWYDPAWKVELRSLCKDLAYSENWRKTLPKLAELLWEDLPLPEKHYEQSVLEAFELLLRARTLLNQVQVYLGHTNQLWTSTKAIKLPRKWKANALLVELGAVKDLSCVDGGRKVDAADRKRLGDLLKYLKHQDLPISSAKLALDALEVTLRKYAPKLEVDNLINPVYSHCVRKLSEMPEVCQENLTECRRVFQETFAKSMKSLTSADTKGESYKSDSNEVPINEVIGEASNDNSELKASANSMRRPSILADAPGASYDRFSLKSDKVHPEAIVEAHNREFESRTVAAVAGSNGAPVGDSKIADDQKLLHELKTVDDLKLPLIWIRDAAEQLQRYALRWYAKKNLELGAVAARLLFSAKRALNVIEKGEDLGAEFPWLFPSVEAPFKKSVKKRGFSERTLSSSGGVSRPKTSSSSNSSDLASFPDGFSDKCVALTREALTAAVTLLEKARSYKGVQELKWYSKLKAAVESCAAFVMPSKPINSDQAPSNETVTPLVQEDNLFIQRHLQPRGSKSGDNSVCSSLPESPRESIVQVISEDVSGNVDFEVVYNVDSKRVLPELLTDKSSPGVVTISAQKTVPLGSPSQKSSGSSAAHSLKANSDAPGTPPPREQVATEAHPLSDLKAIEYQTPGLVEASSNKPPLSDSDSALPLPKTPRPLPRKLPFDPVFAQILSSVLTKNNQLPDATHKKKDSDFDLIEASPNTRNERKPVHDSPTPSRRSSDSNSEDVRLTSSTPLLKRDSYAEAKMELTPTKTDQPSDVKNFEYLNPRLSSETPPPLPNEPPPALLLEPGHVHAEDPLSLIEESELLVPTDTNRPSGAYKEEDSDLVLIEASPSNSKERKPVHDSPTPSRCSSDLNSGDVKVTRSTPSPNLSPPDGSEIEEFFSAPDRSTMETLFSPVPAPRRKSRFVQPDSSDDKSTVVKFTPKDASYPEGEQSNPENLNFVYDSLTDEQSNKSTGESAAPTDLNWKKQESGNDPVTDKKATVTFAFRRFVPYEVSKESSTL